MKIEIDLDQILNDEYGPQENMAQSIHRQIVERLEKDLEKGIAKKVDEEVSSTITKKLSEEIDKISPKFIEELLDASYEKRGRYGEREGSTTFRNELIKTIHEQMTYKPEKESYHSDRENYFTKAVKSILKSETEKFQKEFNAIVTTEFSRNVINQATSELKKKLNL
jgi:restriction endonuclease Mrr